MMPFCNSRFFCGMIVVLRLSQSQLLNTELHGNTSVENWPYGARIIKYKGANMFMHSNRNSGMALLAPSVFRLIRELDSHAVDPPAPVGPTFPGQSISAIRFKTMN